MPGLFRMEPHYLKMLKPRKKPPKWLAVPTGVMAFFAFYFIALAPVRSEGSVCWGSGIFACHYTLVFSLLVGLIVAFCTWVCIR